MRCSRFRRLACLSAFLVAATASAAPAPDGAARAAYLSLPLAFEGNHGQLDPAVRYVARGAGYAMFLTPGEIVVRLSPGDAPGREAVVRMRFVDGAPAPALTPAAPLAGRAHYLLGDDRSRWRTGVPLYGRVRYDSVYPGIDAVIYGNQRELEYDLVVAPGADPAAIELGFRGADRAAIDDDGALVLRTEGGEVVHRKPVVYQLVDGERRPIESAFVLHTPVDGEERVGFRVAHFDRSRPLVIDPVLAYATYLGGPSENDGRAIAVDANGNAYVTGFTNSATFPTVGGLADLNDDLQGARDAFVTKLSPTGALVYSTYLGGTGTDVGNAIAVDASGAAYVGGQTDSADFPLESPLPEPNNALQSQDGFVTKLNAAGNDLVYSTYLGGMVAFDSVNGIAVDGSQNAYVTGTTFSDDFPTAGTFPIGENLNHGGTDAFVAKFAMDGSLVYSIYLGGTGFDQAFAIAVQNGEAYVTGRTQSTDFPLVKGLPAPNDGLRGFQDPFVAKVNAAGNALVYSTYLSGSSDEDDGNAIAVDADGNAYVAGKTRSSNFLSAAAATGTLPAPNTSFRGGADGFVVKIAQSGSANATLGFLAFLGGSSNSQDEGLNGIALDSDRNVYVTGVTTSNDFPVVAGLGLQNRRGQNNGAAIVTKIAAAGNAILYSTYLGGTRQEVGRAIAVDASGNAFVTGQTTSNDFPVKNAAQPTHGSGDFNPDVFVARIDAAAAPALAYTPGNVFVSAVDYGEVREYTPTGTLVRGLPLPSGGFAFGSNPAGIAFDAAGHLFVADLVQNAIFELDAGGGFVGTFASGINAAPQSLAFDGAGNLLVGTTAGPNDVLEYDSSGTLVTQYDVFVHDDGALWLDLGADQRTLLYTSNFGDVSVYDLVTRTQGDDFFIEDTDGFTDLGVRHLPGGGALFAGRGLVRRLDANGAIVKTYTPTPAANLFQVSRDPDGTTLWTANEGVGGLEPTTVIAYDIASAGVVHQFAGPAAFDRPAIGGLAVFGELTEARNGMVGPTATPSPTATRTPAPEICDDCIDNDLDGDVDRADVAECAPHPDGGGQGLTPVAVGKAIVKCGKAIAKAGNKLAATRQKRIQKCVGAALVCVQQKPGDAKCQGKAAATCTKELGNLAADQTKVAAGVQKTCGAAALTFDDVRLAAGLGFDAELSVCAARGVPALASVSDVVSCVLAEHACRAENLVGSRVPRAAEFLRFAGRDPDTELSCLDAPADGGGGNLGVRGKQAVKCQQAMAKAGTKFASTKSKLVQKCAAVVYACVQTKPGDAKCLPKAVTTCGKQFAKLTAPVKGVAAKLATSIAKPCTKAPLALADVLGASGLGFAALGGECGALGAGSLDSIAAIADCIARRHECRVDQMLDNELPRLRELLAIGGVTLP